MPRKYIKKEKESLYTTDDLELALTLIKDKKLTVKDASTNYHISCATLYARISNRRGGGKVGRPTILSDEEEKVLIHVIHKYQEWQHPLTRSDLISIARIFMIELGKQHITEDSLLREWFYSFQTRWYDEIKLVETYKLESIRSLSCTQLVVDRWFEHLQKVLTKLNLFNRPDAIYNVDESGFGDDPGRKQVIIKRDSKYGITSQGGSGKSLTTLLMCTSASGRFLAPYIIYRAQTLFDSWIPTNGYPGARYNATPSGWSEEITFFDWLSSHFIPAISNLFTNHLLPAHCSGGFSKAGIYPFDKRAISKEKLLQSPTASTLNQSYSQSNTSEHISDTMSTTINISSLQRSSSCPNLSLDLSFIPSTDRLSVKDNLGDTPSNDDHISSVNMNTSTSLTTINIPKFDTLIPISISNVSDTTVETTTITTSTSTLDTSTSRILSDAMAVLYSTMDYPVFDESINLQVLKPFDNGPFDNGPLDNDPFDNDPFDINLTTKHDDNSSTNEREQDNHITTGLNPSSTPISNQRILSRSPLDAITIAIENHMKPTIISTERRRKKIDRPYGESVTTVESFLKIKNKENARKKRTTTTTTMKNKEKKEKKEKPQSKKSKVDNKMMVIGDDQSLSTYTTSSFSQQQQTQQIQQYQQHQQVQQHQQYQQIQQYQQYQQYQQHQQVQQNPYFHNSQSCYKCTHITHLLFLLVTNARNVT
ncbi:unnamed protein product [Adineta steineri]|uniref:DDE-1 domain-containing protein n=1 Tax=Adineta steineri TaxID=433720 RepID=A0A820AZK6_9BILA|nr:unnamed protein product [Adineta steineri]